MNRNHCLIAGSCVVCLGIGYFAGSGRETSPATQEKSSPVRAGRPGRTVSKDRQARDSSGEEMLSSLLKGRTPQALSSEELVEIVVRLSKYDPSLDPVSRARQSYQLQLLLAKLSSTQLEDAAGAMAEDPASKRNGALNTIVGALTAKDARRALAWAKDQPNSSALLSGVLSRMAKDDPMAAADLYREGLMDGTFLQNDGWQASYGIGNAMAKLGKKPLLEFLDSLPRQQQDNLLSNTLGELPEGDRIAMMDEIHARTQEGLAESYHFKNLFSNMLLSSPDQALAWLEKMEPGRERADLELLRASKLSGSGDADAAKESMARAIAQVPGKEKELFLQAVNSMSYGNPRDLAQFSSMLPASAVITADDLKNQVSNSLYRGLGSLVDLAGAIQDPAEQSKLLVGALENFTKTASSNPRRKMVNETDYAIFERRLASLNLSGDNRRQVQDALAAARAPKENLELLLPPR